MKLTACIVEWRADRGFGFLDFEGQRIFVHRRDFAAFHRTPAPGDPVEFVLGQDRRGRYCAQQAELVHDGGRIRGADLLLLAVLLLTPAAALWGLLGSFAWYLVFGGAVAPSLVAYLAYAHDKGRSRAGGWRVAESTLHWLAMLGGWPGAYLAQRRYRHKTAKLGFQLVFWSTVALHEYLAADYVFGGRLTQTLGLFLRR